MQKRQTQRIGSPHTLFRHPNPGRHPAVLSSSLNRVTALAAGPHSEVRDTSGRPHGKFGTRQIVAGQLESSLERHRKKSSFLTRQQRWLAGWLRGGLRDDNRLGGVSSTHTHTHLF